MKLAILFTGRINDNKDQYENIMKNLVNNQEVDFFISYPKDTNKDMVQKVSQLYNPKIIIENNEEYFNVDKYKKRPETNKHNVLSMYLSRLNIKNAFNDYVRTTNIHYDVIISTRIDLRFKCEINLIDSLKHIQNNELCIPNPVFDYLGINDQFAMGNSNTIDTYLNAYNSLFELLESGVILHPETLLINYLRNNNMTFHRFDFPYVIQR
jgi:hypothetical protein